MYVYLIMMPFWSNVGERWAEVVEIYRDEKEAERKRKILEDMDGIKYFIEEWPVI